MKTVKKVFSVLMTLVIVLTIIPMTAMESSAAESWLWPLANYTNWTTYDGHRGIDIPAPSGTPIRAAKSGTLYVYNNTCNGSHYGASPACTISGCNSNTGKCVYIIHNDGTASCYMHMVSLAVTSTKTVSQGDIIGYVGTTGPSTGNHLHFEAASGSGSNYWSYSLLNPGYLSYIYNTSVSTTGISLNTKQFTLGVGESKTITATVTPSNATNKNVTWSSSDASVVTVSGGVVKAVGAGGAVITAKTASGGYEAYAEVVVNETAIRPMLTSFYNGHYYELYSQHMAWEQAKTFCENKGGHLVTINSEGENDAILQMITEVQPQTSDYEGFFIGISDAGATQGDYSWITDEELTYENWADGEPNNTLWSACHERYQDYGLINTNGQWCDTNNYQNVRSHVGFIYEHDVPQEPDAVTVIDGKVYELWDRQYTISAADDFAEEKGGYLLSLTSAEEQAAVGTWLRANTSSKYIALGATDEETEGVWKWTSGEPWSYTNWNTGEPNNTNGIENNAIWILSSDNWNDTNSANAYAFVIEYTTTPAPTVTAISVASKPSKTVYTQNEELDTSGLSLKVTYSDGTSKVITSGFTVSAPDMTTAGTKTVTAMYGGKATSFTITVKSSTPAITVDSRNAVCGQQIKIPIILEKAELGTLIMDITYDSTKLQLTSVEGIPFDMSKINTATAGKIRVTAMDNTCVSAGTIAVLTFDVIADAACSTNISVSVDRAYDADDNEVDLTVFNGTLEISKPSYGDINGDGSLDSADYAMVRAYATGNIALDDVQKIAADLNRDGAVDAYDAIYLDLYLNGYLETL